MEHASSRVSGRLRFGTFEVDPATGELRKQGVKVKLQEQPFQALLMMLEHPGEIVTREDLRKRLWPEDTFVDFDRGLNRTVNRVRDALGDSAENPRFIETLSQRGYRFIAPVEAPAPSLPVVPSAGPRPRLSLRTRVLAAGAALLTAGLLAFTWNVKDVSQRLGFRASPRVESLAVLPLENLSADPAQEYFADGMTDGLITEIANIGSLKVTSRTSIMRYKLPRKPLPIIAKELGVDALLEGAVLHSGDRVRITAQLIRARDDRHLWSEKYERDLSDILKLQSEVAQAIARQIQIELKPSERASGAGPRGVKPEAVEAYLKGNHFMRRSTPEGLERSIGFFNQAIELDPTYAQAHAGLSQSYIFLGIFGLRPSGDAYSKARFAALKALELDQTNAEALNALADVKKGYDWDWPGAEKDYTRALELSPSYFWAHAWYADYLSKMGRHVEAIAEARRARGLDPVAAGATSFLGMILYRARKYEEAIAACQKAIELDPHHPHALWFQGLALEQRGEIAKAIASLEKAVGASGGAPLYRALLGHAFALAGERTKAVSILDELMRLSKDGYVSPLDIAIVYTGLADHDAAFQWLEKAYQERTMRIQELPEPIFDSLRSDPRFQDLMRRIGLPL